MAVSVLVLSLLAGAYAVVTQAYLAREFLAVFGGSEMAAAILLGGWAAGAAAGARASRLRPLERLRPAYLAVTCALGWLTLALVALVAARIARSLVGVAPGQDAGPVAVAAAALISGAGPAALAGLLLMAVSRLARGLPSRDAPAALVLVATGVGCVGGGILFTVVLSQRCSPFTIALGAYPLFAAAAVALAWAAAGQGGLARRTAMTLTVGAALFAATGAALLAGGRDAVLESHTAVARMLSIREGLVVDARESRGRNLTTIMRAGRYTLFGNGGPLFTFPEPGLRERDAHLVLAQHGAPRDVLIIGASPEFLAPVLSYGVRRVDYLPGERDVLEAVRPLLDESSRDALLAEGVRVHWADARAFVRGDDERGWDVIAAQLPEPSTLLADRLCTVEFLSAVRERLAPGGIFAALVTRPDDDPADGAAGRDPAAASLHATMAAVFDEVLVTRDRGAIAFGAARQGVLTTDPEALSARFLARGVQSHIYPGLFWTIFAPDRAGAGAGAAADSRGARVNSDLRPAGLMTGMALRAREGSTAARVVPAVARAPRAATFAAAVVAVFAGTLLVAGGARRARRPAASAFWNGVVAMGAAVVLMYAFQVETGELYSGTGVMTGALFGGAALGAAAGCAWLQDGRHRAAAAAGVMAAMPLVAAAVIAAGPALPSGALRWALGALVALCGAAAGFEIARSATGHDPGARTEAGSPLPIALAGASVGAVLWGAILAPALGHLWSLALLAAVKAAATFATRGPRGGGRRQAR